MKFVQQGDPKPATLTVGDIYGKNYIDLPADAPAAFLAKNENPKIEDQISALHQAICINTAHIAVLNAKLHGLKRIIFSGGFVSEAAEKQLDFGVQFYSNKQIECIFMRHDAMLGSIGALLGKEIEYYDTKDQLSQNIERNLQQLEQLEESETYKVNIKFAI